MDFELEGEQTRPGTLRAVPFTSVMGASAASLPAVAGSPLRLLHAHLLRAKLDTLIGERSTPPVKAPEGRAETVPNTTEWREGGEEPSTAS